jgi:hypothetical protein
MGLLKLHPFSAIIYCHKPDCGGNSRAEIVAYR